VKTEGTFDVTLMRIAAMAGAYEAFTATLDHENIEFLKQHRDWDRERVLSITPEQMEEPTLWVLVNSDEHLLIDGTHLLLARADHGLFEFRGYMARLNQVIRPDPNEMWFNPNHQWGQIEIRDGVLYDRATGKRIE
jgi:hypothetical protein